jgi:hypothetical protein
LRRGCRREYFNLRERSKRSLEKIAERGASYLYSLSNVIRIIKLKRMRRAGHVVRIGEKRSAYRDFVGKPERQGPLGRPACRWGCILLK